MTPMAPRKVQQQLTNATMFPAPTGGVNGRVSLAQTPLNNCIFAFNLVPSEFGMRTRKGYNQHQLTIPGTKAKTIIPFQGQDSANDALFAASNTGIYDVTTAGGTPSLEVAFGTTTGDAGYAIIADFTNDSGAHFILLADAVNGLYTYTESTGVWAAHAALTYAAGTPPAVGDIAFVMTHKQRVWLIEKDTQTAWYFAAGSLAGDVTPFYFGGLFPRGGELVGLWNWTLDGGDGPDDILVAVSRAGDVIPYKGADPSGADTWANIGIFQIGQLPAGRRQGRDFDGDLHLVSNIGITSMSALLRGVSGAANVEGLGYNVARFLREQMELTRDTLGWEIRQFTNEGIGSVNAPTIVTDEHQQFIINLAVSGWGVWRNVNAFTAEEWLGDVYFLRGVNIYKMTGSLDDVDKNGAGGTDVPFSILSAFSMLEQPAQFKIMQFIRPQFLATAEPSFNVAARYDFDVDELVASAPIVPTTAAVWDTAVWDTAEWVGGDAGFDKLFGSAGIGRWVAIVMNGAVRQRTTLVGWDLQWTSGWTL